MSNWLYQPVTIHYANPTLVNATSGVYIYNSVTAENYFLTISSIPKPASFSYCFTSSDLVKSSTIDWLPLILESASPINEGDEDLGFSDFIYDRVYTDGFNFVPNGVNDLAVLIFGLGLPTTKEYGLLMNPEKMIPFEPITTRDTHTPSKIVISCCPFSLTNVAVFIDYKARGSINYRINDAGYLSDCRYLDNMMGGMVSLDQGVMPKKERSLGLVYGSIQKKNGDGNLMAIISWDTIIRVIGFPLFGNYDRYLNGAINPSKASSKKGSLSDSIVRISVETTDNENFWGSGVVISDKYIITNEHVMKLDRLKRFTIDIPGHPQVTLTNKDTTVIRSPIRGYDLCFIWVNMDRNAFRPVKRCSSYVSQKKSLRPGSYVQSLGYGLFYLKNKLDLLPIHSEGHISRLVPLELSSGHQETALMIASAGCWNGSSGGGIFNSSGELVGIMTSNGKLSNGEIIPDFTLVIPITIIEKCIFMMHNNLKMDLSEKIKDLWHLKNTHTSVLITTPPPRDSKL